MYIAAGQGQTAPGDKNFYVNRNLLSLWSFATSLKNLFEDWFYTIFFMILYMYIAPGQQLTTPWDEILMSTGTDNPLRWKFDVNRNILSFWSFVASLKKISLKSDFIHFFFMILYMYIAPGQGQTAPTGQSLDVNRNVLSLHLFVASFKKSLWSLIL